MSEHRPEAPKDLPHRRVRSLRELPQERMPERDLWPQIEARVTERLQARAPRQAQAPPAERLQAAPAATVGPSALAPHPGPRPRRLPWSGWRLQLAAAVGLLAIGGALTLGVWMTHGSAARGPLPRELLAIDEMRPQLGPLDGRQREALLRSLNARLEALPAPSRQKVLADLDVIQRSMRDIQAALGRDPGNALLRAMLQESYQDEQQLIATVQEAGKWTSEAGTGDGSI